MPKKFDIYSQRDFRLFYWIGFILYLTLSFIFFKTYVSELTTDLISYLQIAKKYSEGHFKEALNAYWSPLISWLLIPFFWTDLDPFTSFRILNLIAGILLLLLIIKVGERFDLSPIAKIFSFFTFCIFSFYYQVSAFTPDFLSILTIFLYLYVLTSPLRHSDPYYFLKVGLTAGLGFFAKSYFLPFFLVQFFLFILFEAMQSPEKKKILFKNTLKVYVVFFIVAGTWVALLSFKYEKFVISSSGSYNFSLITSADYPGDKPQYYDIGLLPPPDPYSISSWDDPTYYPVKTRDVFGSMDHIYFQLKISWYNTKLLPYLFKWFSYFGFALLAVLIYIPFFSQRKSRRDATVFAYSTILYLAGYLLIFFEERYVLPAYFLLILVAFYTLDDFLSRFKFSSAIRCFLFLIVSFAFLKNPWHGTKEKSAGLQEGYYYRDAALRLKDKEWLHHKKIASSFEYELTGLIAFLNQSYSYGCLNSKRSHEENSKSLEQHQIDYYLYFKCRKPFLKKICSEEIPFYLKNKPLVYKDEALNLFIFKLR